MKTSISLRARVCAALFLILLAAPVQAADKAALEGRLAATVGAGQGDDASVRLSAIRAFYASRGFGWHWTDGRALSGKAQDALDLLQAADKEGLEPADYLSAVLPAPARFETHDAAARFEIALSDAMLGYLSDLRTGRVAPSRLDPDLFVAIPAIDGRDALERLAAGDGPRTAAGHYTPGNPVYRNLRDSLATYRRVAELGGWPVVPEGPKLEEGVAEPRVAALRSRLAATKDLLEPDSGSEQFDASLKQAVIAFQRRHGLDTDGVVGPATLAALNVPVEDRIDQIKWNMERWRWMPDDLGTQHVLVNIAAFELQGVMNGTIRKRMRVVVGREYRRTPVFSDAIQYMEVNPYWHVPTSIAVKDLLPKIKANLGYLASEGFSVLDGWGANARRLDPQAIDWNALGGGRFPYKLRQDPGAKNALGRIKFMFPNKHDVYLHDSPARELFGREIRTFSSGCIRVENPQGLAEFLLATQSQPKTDELNAAFASKDTRIVRLAEPVPVHLAYFTAWTDEDGTVQFRKDIYGRDRDLAAALGRT
ncbi:MAG: L,D-transpeptidase family protein [Alphaproteobacteria bacterium]|nr:L,D-transpeptidase family protein [Alphaproteobacteria bacterium]